jgi:hypothetical protein
MADTITLGCSDYYLTDVTAWSSERSPITWLEALAPAYVGSEGSLVRDAESRSLWRPEAQQMASEQLMAASSSLKSAALALENMGVGRLRELSRLEPGWNSHSAKPIAPENILAAMWILVGLANLEPPSPVIVPTVRGGVQIEWHTNGVNIEIYVESPNDVSFFAGLAESGEAVELPLAGHEQELRKWLKRACGK